ncbi:hypothetical protein JCM6882_006371 [Rhodosporidiobolus microsporus]
MPFPTFDIAGTSKPIPAIAFGTGSDWRANPRPVGPDGVASEVVDVIVSAAKAGFRHFDAAENYKNEVSVGAGLEATGLSRDELYITSKVHPSLGKVEEEIQRQLKLLRVDYLDLYLIHSPKAAEQAGLTLKEAWARLEALVDQGLVRAIGVSNYAPIDFDSFFPSARIKPVVNQISVYPYVYHRALPNIIYAQKHGIRIEAYELSSSLIRESEKGGPLDPVLDKIAAEHSKDGKTFTPGQVLLGWSAAKGFVAVTTSSKPARLQEYIDAGEITLTPEQVEAIDQAGKEGAEQGYGKYWSWQ